ncbi:hypothetical protein [Afifella pfennigii]|uniref:hypothetical protein n=1 Tax=Afifella pfennigii TaxID=209897 RepID=UPI00047DD884|nr:hypothetical protein [Afifella pfennigii]
MNEVIWISSAEWRSRCRFLAVLALVLVTVTVAFEAAGTNGARGWRDAPMQRLMAMQDVALLARPLVEPGVRSRAGGPGEADPPPAQLASMAVPPIAAMRSVGNGRPVRSPVSARRGERPRARAPPIPS